MDRVRIPDIIATHLLPNKLYVTAPTPAAPTVFAIVFNERIAANGRLILSFNFSNDLPEVGFFLLSMLINERLIESNTDSSREQRNEIPKAKKKYRNNVAMYCEFMLFLIQTAMPFDVNISLADT